MKHFYVWNVRKGKRFVIIMGLALCTALFLFIEERGLYSSDSSKQVALTKGSTVENAVALTFNISWGEEKVLDILDVLQSEEIRATFFVSGEWAERHPHIIEKITDGQHELGMLGYRYKSYLDQEIDQVRKDIIYANEVFTKLGYENIEYLRTPSGHFDKDIISLANELNYDVIHWSVNPNDWENPGVKAIEKTVLDLTSSGDIVLLHASDSATQTAQALQTIIPALKEKDLTFVTVSTLQSGVTTKEKILDKK